MSDTTIATYILIPPTASKYATCTEFYLKFYSSLGAGVSININQPHMYQPLEKCFRHSDAHTIHPPQAAGAGPAATNDSDNRCILRCNH